LLADCRPRSLVFSFFKCVPLFAPFCICNLIYTLKIHGRYKVMLPNHFLVLKITQEPGASIRATNRDRLFLFPTASSRACVPQSIQRLGYGLGDRGIGVSIPAGSRDLSLLYIVKTGSGPTLPPIQWVPGALSPGAKRPDRKDHHSFPSSAEVKKVFIVWCLIRQRGSFTCTFTNNYCYTV
jgi:hypothetical protein